MWFVGIKTKFFVTKQCSLVLNSIDFSKTRISDIMKRDNLLNSYIDTSIWNDVLHIDVFKHFQGFKILFFMYMCIHFLVQYVGYWRQNTFTEISDSVNYRNFLCLSLKTHFCHSLLSTWKFNEFICGLFKDAFCSFVPSMPVSQKYY